MAGDLHYLKLLDDMRELHIRKNAGDADDRWINFRKSEDFGVTPLQGCLVRLSDKYIRVGNLMKNPDNEQVGENIKDTLMDMAAYALIAICLLEENENRQLNTPRS